MKRDIYKKYGQAMLEFLFCMIIIMLMIYSMMMILRWVGIDLANRRIDHEKVLFRGGIDPLIQPEDVYIKSPQIQLDSYFHKPIKMNAVTDWF